MQHFENISDANANNLLGANKSSSGIIEDLTFATAFGELDYLNELKAKEYIMSLFDSQTERKIDSGIVDVGGFHKKLIVTGGAHVNLNAIVTKSCHLLGGEHITGCIYIPHEFRFKNKLRRVGTFGQFYLPREFYFYQNGALNVDVKRIRLPWSKLREKIDSAKF